jgi:hypothetical protein
MQLMKRVTTLLRDLKKNRCAQVIHLVRHGKGCVDCLSAVAPSAVGDPLFSLPSKRLG